MGRIYLDEDVSADGQTLILDANKNADYQTLIEEKFFRQMLAYPFSWISNRKSTSKLDMIQGRMGGLLTYTQEEFDREPDNEGYEFDEKDFKDYQRKFLDTMEKQLIDEIVKDLRRENLLPKDILSKEILAKMKEMGFILSDLDNNNKLQRTMKAKKTVEVKDGKKTVRFREGLPFGAMDDDTTGGFIGAFLDSRPILYEEIKDHIKVKKPNQIIFDTEKYIEEISVSEGYGKLEKEDSKLTIAGSRGRELDKEVEIFSVGKTNDGRYRMEGFGKTRLIDDVEETWDVYRDLLSLENLEKYIEKVILSQKQSPLKNILLSLVEPEDRMLEVGKLNIFVDNLSVGGNQSVGFGNTDVLTKETWMKWLRRTEDKKVEGNKDVKMVGSLMNLAFDLFDADVSPDEAKIDNHPLMTKVKEKKFRKAGTKDLPERVLADLTVEELYDIWKTNGKPTSADPDKVDDLANALLRQAMGDDVIEITRDKEGRKFPVLESGKGKTGMVRLRVNFRPTKLVSAKDYEIYQERIDAGGRRMPEPKERDRLGTETGETDRRLGGRRGPVTATELDRKQAQDVEKDFKSIMELKLGYNRLKGLVN